MPEGPAAIARCVVDSLALSYRTTAEDLAAITGTAPPAVCVTGGGARNGLLAQATADATGLPVLCGPVEATSLGNAATQLVALGELGGIADIRALVARTTDLRLGPRARIRAGNRPQHGCGTCLRTTTASGGSSRPDQRTTWKPPARRAGWHHGVSNPHSDEVTE